MQTQRHFADHWGEAHWPGLLLASSLRLALTKGTAVHLTAECCPGGLVIFEACLALVLLTQLQTVSGRKRWFPYEIVPNEHRARERRASSSKEIQGCLVTSLKKKKEKDIRSKIRLIQIKHIGLYIWKDSFLNFFNYMYIYICMPMCVWGVGAIRFP